MQYRKLGSSGLKVSVVSVGSWLTHGRTVDLEGTRAIMRTAFDAGINFFDTADVYHRGAAETVLGQILPDYRRADLVIATKCFFPMSDGPNDRGLSRKHIFESVHDSLQRLQTDYIDLYQFHRYDSETPLEESISAVNDLVKQGKILYWGVSEWSAAQIAEAASIARDHYRLALTSNQPQYNLLNPYIEQGVIPTSERFGVGQVVFSPLAQGILTGKYRPGQPPPEGSRGADDSSNQFMHGWLTDASLEKVVRAEALVKDAGMTLGEYALAWCLRNSNVASVITGASRPEQVTQNVRAASLTLSEELIESVEAVIRPKE